jgi:hypothetical protein
MVLDALVSGHISIVTNFANYHAQRVTRDVYPRQGFRASGGGRDIDFG